MKSHRQRRSWRLVFCRRVRYALCWPSKHKLVSRSSWRSLSASTSNLLLRQEHLDMRRVMMCMAGSVGKNGRNERHDVKTVQILLNVHRGVLRLPAPLAEDGGMGPKTLAAIEAFQRTVVGMANPDGRID